MAANLSILADGTIEAATALKPAWWDASGNNTLDFVPDSEQMIQAAHLDWKIGLHECRDENGKGIGYYYTRREDTGLALGCGLSANYKPVQNSEGFKVLDSLLQDGIMKYEAAGALAGGQTVWALARMPSVDYVADGDAVKRYLLWLNNNDGKGGLFCIPTTVRVVCQNTARIAIHGQRGIRHTGDMDSKIREVSLMLSQYDQQFTNFVEEGRKLASMKFGSDAAREYIRKLFPDKDAEGKPLKDRAATTRERKVEEVRKALRNERQNMPSIKGTWWSLYNAVSEAVDHGDLFGVRGDKTQRAERSMMSKMDGAGADFKQQAWQLAIAMAA